MASRFQAVTLVDSPSYPNSIAWSDENLIAVASGHLVTILNPALPFGPRGLISINRSEPYPIGAVLDLTDRLYDYLASISFEDPDIPPSEISNEPVTNHGYVDDPTDSVSVKEQKRRKVNNFGVRNAGLETSCDQISRGPSPSPELEGQGPPKCKDMDRAWGGIFKVNRSQ
ncbi:nuclear distribution pac1 [Gossypium australe]|uniref:Nuclear distribution pac1 n=1 Tax=Gossypium australe TaxID=47621 RepID=A0A5B6VLU8_9ROSI|nr:nuclear distribution pac1 [Gossypium australe]